MISLYAPFLGRHAGIHLSRFPFLRSNFSRSANVFVASRRRETPVVDIFLVESTRTKTTTTTTVTQPTQSHTRNNHEKNKDKKGELFSRVACAVNYYAIPHVP